MKQLIGLLLFLAGACCAQAQFAFTVTATANSTGSGYTSGQTATFTFAVTGADVSGNNSNQFFSYTNQWWDDITADTPIFTAVTGTGISGTLARPSANGNDPFSYIQALPPSPSQLTFTAGAENSDIGLVVNGATVGYILAGNLDWGQSFPAPGSYTAPTTFFAPFIGTHPLNSGGYVDIYLTSADTTVSFTATSLTISAIPEPSAGAAILGGAGLVAAGLFRRRRQQPAR